MSQMSGGTMVTTNERRDQFGGLTMDYKGKCVGGPWAGQNLAHTSRVKPLFRNYADEPVMIGEYKLNDFGQWHWWETEKGRAIEVLRRSQPPPM